MPELPYLAFHWTLGLPFRAVKSVHPSARHDVHAAPIDRERVLDVLAEADRADPARLRVEDGDLAVCLGHEPDAALEVGERRADARTGPARSSGRSRGPCGCCGR